MRKANYTGKGTAVVAEQLGREMKIHNGFPLPRAQGGNGLFGKHTKPQTDSEVTFSISLCPQAWLPGLLPGF